MAFKKIQKKLSLNKVTISHLGNGQMNGVLGGINQQPDPVAATLNYTNCNYCFWVSELYSACCITRLPQYCPTYVAQPYLACAHQNDEVD